MDEEAKRLAEQAAALATAIDEANGRIGPSALDNDITLIAIVAGARSDNPALACGLLGLVGGMLKQRRVIPQPISDHLAEAFFSILRGADPASALGLKVGHKTSSAHARRNANIFAVVEQLKQGHKEGAFRMKRGETIYHRAQSALLDRGIGNSPTNPLSAKRIKTIYEAERRRKGALAAYSKGSATEGQVAIVQSMLVDILDRLPKPR